LKTLTIIDTFGFFFRAYYALPPLKNSEGFPTGLLTGFINLVDSLHREHSTDYLVFALDSKGETFRNKIYPAYKANRESPPPELTQQLPVAIDWIEKMGFANLSREGFEADDIITTVTKFAKAKDIKVKIVSHDKDLYQLIDDSKVVMYDAIKKKEIDEKACIEKFGINPKDFVDFQALLGDSSDNVPGVKGIGKVTAAKLINQFHTLENIYEHIDKALTPRVQKLLLEGKESAFLSRELVTMRDDVYDSLDVESFVFEDKNYLSVLIDEFEKYEMKQALKKATSNTQIKPTNKQELPKLTFEAITLDTKDKLQNIISQITPDTIIAYDSETTSLDTKEANIVGFSFCMDEQKAYYVPVAHSYLGVGPQIELKDALEAIKKIFQAKVVGQNLKFDLSLLYNRYGFDKKDVFADSMIMAWLLDSSSKVGLDALADRYFDYDMKSFKDVVKKGQDFSSVDIEDATFYASEDAWMSLKLYNKFDNLLESQLKDEARDVEYPFINVLCDMERVGIRVDIDKLTNLKNKLTLKLNELTSEIYTLAGGEFNIKSTQQLANILFEKLGLKGGKKTKTGYSTNEATLLSLKDQHPIIDLILQYREAQKLNSTYVEPLIKLGKKDKNHRIYTSFLQTGTATGRLSSKDPNLQNIPVRSPLGKEVRDAFVAKDGYKLVSIDYSQIELRLLAHFSQDSALKEAFLNGEDIHLATATKLFGKMDAQKKRNIAKSINFGLLYGMGPKKLSAEIGVSQSEAKEIIKNYFETFPTVKSYLESIQEDAKSNGYVTTLLGRKRYFDYEGANGMQKAAILRESVNTVFQGSAADLIKLSMLKISKTIDTNNYDCNMLLQIHDELIFEIQDEKAHKLSLEFSDIMSSIYKLNVPLECSISIAKSWGELK
jgi:DNA polymerase-1